MVDSSGLKTVADNIDQVTAAACERWKTLAGHVLDYRCSKDAWSIKEVVGHLIDSASNNHQRFVRLQLQDQLVFPDYSKDNEKWVKIQHYQERSWEELLLLWRYYNLHLADLLRRVNPACLENAWVADAGSPITLHVMMVDYLRHLNDHIGQIESIIENCDR
jgi:hypothetical protein